MEQEEIDRLATSLIELQSMAKKLRVTYSQNIRLRLPSYRLWAHIVNARKNMNEFLSLYKND